MRGPVPRPEGSRHNLNAVSIVIETGDDDFDIALFGLSLERAEHISSLLSDIYPFSKDVIQADVRERSAARISDGGMNAQAKKQVTVPKSWARPCVECDGTGEVHNGRGQGGNDPDSWMIECQQCEGAGYYPCEVCGNTVHTNGYDCVVCDSLGDVLSNGLTKEQSEILTRCFGDQLARASESYIPAQVAT